MTQATIALETPRQPDVERLLQAADRRSASLYPSESRFGSAAATLVRQQASFYVVRLDGRAIGCGGFVLDADGDAELKRIFVEDAARGAGIGRMILHALEQAAKRQGVRTMRLETGVKSVEAIGLYRRFGYAQRGPFGSYGPDPQSVFMEKRLTPNDPGPQERQSGP